MMKAVATDWGDFVPGRFPTDVTNIKAVSSSTLTHDHDQGVQPEPGSPITS